MPFGAAAVLPNVNSATRPTKDTPQGGLEPLRLSLRGLEAGRHDAEEPEAGVLHKGVGELRGTHLGPVHGPVVPKEGYARPGSEKVPPRRGCQRNGGLPQRGQPPVEGDVRLPRDGGCDGAHYPQLEQRRRRAIVVGTVDPARAARTPGGRLHGIGGVSPAVPAGLRPTMAAVIGVALRPGGRPSAAGGVSPAVTVRLRVPVVAAMGVALRPGRRPGAAGGVSPAVSLAVRVPVAAAVGVAQRPGGRPCAAGGVSPAVRLGLRVPVAAAMGVELTALADVGAPHEAVSPGSSMAATVTLTGRRPRAVIPRAGTAAHSALPTVPGVVACASGAATGIGRLPVTKFGTGRAGVVVMPLLGQAAVGRRHGPVMTGRRITVPVGVGRWGRRGFAAGPRAWTSGTPFAQLPVAPSGHVRAQLVDGRPGRGEGGWPSRDTRLGAGRGPKIGGPGLHRAATLLVRVPPLPGVVRGRPGRLLRRRRDIPRVGQGESGGHRPGLVRHR